VSVFALGAHLEFKSLMWYYFNVLRRFRMVKLDEATLTSQGQISVSRKIRERLHLQKGAKIAFFDDGKGHIFIQEIEAPVEFSPQEWDEFLAKTKKEPITRVHGKAETLRHLDRLMKK
jgi:bifunctional DNA-binding transcriptional regulator/antitoxin component of YhaV-PrlF toxin-antitoxin module